MAALSGSLTLAEIAKRLDPQGKAAPIGELLNQTNQVLDDVPWVEANDGESHVYTLRTSLPSISWINLNTGITPTVSSTAQSRDACGIMGAVVEVDKNVAEKNGQIQANIDSEVTPHIEAMGQEFSDTLFYGNAATVPTEFTGLAPRFNSLTGTTGENIVSGGGSSTDNSSIWLVDWGVGKVYGIYPRGSKAGLEQINRGLQSVDTTAGVGSAGARLLAYQVYLFWKCGIAVQDWRRIVRGCNIDISNLVAKSGAADLFDIMIKMIHRLPDGQASSSARFYVNRSVMQMLDIQGRDDVQAGGQLGYAEVAGKKLPAFRGIPIRLVDKLTESESAVS